ncbi:CocE/NonD family hydrolase [Megalodesulfovibrio paquesii]
MDAMERRAVVAGRKTQPRSRWRVVALVVLGLVAAALVVGWMLLRPESAVPTPEDHAALLAVFGGTTDPGPPRYAGRVRQSFHLPMRDGVDIAVDLYLPAGLSSEVRIPVILLPTRYWRRWNLRWPASALTDAPLATRMFTDYGYAVVSIDARGTGASFGVQNYPWSSDEIEDYLEVLDWAVQQPWSNGRAGVAGVSYGGSCAERLAAVGHPALKAAIVQFALYDVFTDVAYPGGVFNSGFVGRWGRFNEALDNGTLPQGMPWLARAFVQGPAPVDGPQGPQKLAQALLEHADNADIYLAAAGASSRDQTAVTERGVAVAMDDFSPHTAWKKTGRAQRPAVYAWGGWFDGAYARSLLRRYCEAPVVQRAVLGPWNHGATKDVDPFAERDAPVSPSPRVQVLEQIRFFDWYLKDVGEQPESGLRYRRFGEATWHTAAQWPAVSAPQVLQLRQDATLAAPDVGRAQPEVGHTEGAASGPGRILKPGPAPTGANNRWRTQLGRGDVYYPDMGERAGEPGRLSWTSAPLEQTMLLEGSPVLRTALSVNATDLSLFAYLEVLTPEGKGSQGSTPQMLTPRMLTEGLLRALHRKEKPCEALQDRNASATVCTGTGALHSYVRADMATLTPGEPAQMAVQLLPVAARLPAGSRLRLTLTTCDTGQFTCQPFDSNPDVLILPGGVLELPLAEAAPLGPATQANQAQ